MAETHTTPEALVKDTTVADSDLIMKTDSNNVTKTVTAGNFFTWLWGKIKGSTKSTLDATDPTAPVNTNAVNGALTNYVKDVRIGTNENVDANNWRADNCNYIFPEWYDGTALNVPSWTKQGGGKLECKTWGNYSTQIFYPYGSSSNLAYMRSCSYWEGYHWTEWQQIIVSNPSIDWDTGHFNIGNIKIAWAAVNCDNGEFNINCELPISFVHFSVILCVPYYNSSPNSQVFSTWGGANTNVVSAHVRSVDTNAFKFLAIGY